MVRGQRVRDDFVAAEQVGESSCTQRDINLAFVSSVVEERRLTVRRVEDCEVQSPDHVFKLSSDPVGGLVTP